MQQFDESQLYQDRLLQTVENGHTYYLLLNSIHQLMMTRYPVSAPLLYPRKTENLWLVVFSGYKNENSGLKWVKVLFTRFI